eukprot:TRINITY_DN216_c0_g1_i8.p1 TRINITY_DN216_c0_g1~~TRINITY_DN216_c0_g1_i8.p1  ORF type:complete len:245 (-),score=68.24 TRINITY_DN216_c0_g1_i8:228-962(-)
MDNEAANEYWEYKLPKDFRRLKESSSADEVWRFIQRKYVRKEFVPKNAADPVTEYKESPKQKKPSKKKPATPSTDEDSTNENTRKRVKNVEKKAEKVENKVEKVDIKDLLDIEIDGQEKPKVAAKEEAPKTEMLWDLFDSNAATQSKVETVGIATNANAVQPVNVPVRVPVRAAAKSFINPQANRYAAFDQTAYPTQSSNFSWNAYNSIPSCPINYSFGVQKVEKRAENKLDSQFADLLPSDFL